MLFCILALNAFVCRQTKQAQIADRSLHAQIIVDALLANIMQFPLQSLFAAIRANLVDWFPHQNSKSCFAYFVAHALLFRVLVPMIMIVDDSVARALSPLLRALGDIVATICQTFSASNAPDM